MAANKAGKRPTLADILMQRAATHGDREAYVFLSGRKLNPVSLSYAGLDRRARVIASRLEEADARGERALLVYPPGLDYISAFFACLYSGTIAVPIYPPLNEKMVIRLQIVLADAGAKIVLSNHKVATYIRQVKVAQLLARAPGLSMLLKPYLTRLGDLRGIDWSGVEWIETDRLDQEKARGWTAPSVEADDIAFLQYTSGSTGRPKGVVVTNGNIVSNTQMIAESFASDAREIHLSWLPLYHDMGLIGTVLLSMYEGGRCILMSPQAFLQDPLVWIECIAKYGATASGGPNFGYDLCVKKLREGRRELAAVDLSRWRVAFNGAEAVRARTLTNFCDAFARFGFRRRAFEPTYGLAEATLAASAGDTGAVPVVTRADRTALRLGRLVVKGEGDDADEVQEVVGCGRSMPGQEIAIVDPATLIGCAEGEEGEIWIRGPSVARGYWEKPEVTEQTFRAIRRDTGEGPYLRTGDLGVLVNGELYVTGRLKETIIILGQNYYPHDIEDTVQHQDELFRKGCAAAFTVNRDGEPRLVVVQELRSRPADAVLTRLFDLVRDAVFQEHQLSLHVIVFIRRRTLPKTTSGKLQRGRCRDLYESSALDELASWSLG